MLRRQFLASALALQSQRRPNIVFIMADDMGYADLGCYGQKYIKTPNIDKLATEGMRFTDAYAGCTVCAPSRSVLMTGKHTGHTSIRSNPGAVPLLDEDLTVAEVLKQAGYTTGCYGKWGLGDVGSNGAPWKQGFDDFYGFLSQVHAHYQYPKVLFHNDKEHSIGDAFANDKIADRAVAFTRDAVKRNQPFFLYTPFTLPHLELLAPEDGMKAYDGVLPEDGPYDQRRGHYAFQPKPRAAYAAMVSRIDKYVGMIVNEIKSLGVEDNTIIFVTSDNGTATPIWNDKGFFKSAGPFRGYKTNFYEGGIRTPMIVRWKGRIKPGVVSDLPWYFADVLPTFAELAGVAAPKGIDGISVAPTLLGKGSQKRHEYLYWELPRYIAASGTFADAPPPAAIRMGKWKAVRPTEGAPIELYDLSKDIAETTDVAAANPAVMKKIEAIAKDAHQTPRMQKDAHYRDWSKHP